MKIFTRSTYTNNGGARHTLQQGALRHHGDHQSQQQHPDHAAASDLAPMEVCEKNGTLSILEWRAERIREAECVNGWRSRGVADREPRKKDSD